MGGMLKDGVHLSFPTQPITLTAVDLGPSYPFGVGLPSLWRILISLTMELLLEHLSNELFNDLPLKPIMYFH